MSVQALAGVRARMLPMLQVAAEQYRERVPEGYPVVVDSVESGVIGIEFDPSYALYVSAEGDELYADIYRRAPRIDNRSGASRQKYAGLPYDERRRLEPDVSDQVLRNLVHELMHYWNTQPNVIFVTDD